VLDRRVHRRLGDSDVDGRVAGHQPVRHELGDDQGQPLHPTEQDAGRHDDIQVQVMGAGGAHAQRIPGGLHLQALRPGGYQELGDHGLIGGTPCGHEVAVAVPGTGDEGLRALDVEAAVDLLVGGGELGQAGAHAPFAHRHGVPVALRRRGKQPVPGGERLVRYAERLGQLLGHRAECSGHGGVHVEHQGGGPVAAGQLVRDRRVVGEPRTDTAQPVRHQQPEQAGGAQVREVVDGKATVAIMRRGPRGEPRRQPPRRGHRVSCNAH
jgi:hypothetical protein